MSFMQRLEQAHANFARGRDDRWRKKLEPKLRTVEAMSSVALLDLIGVPATTGNARRLAHTMRAMGWVGFKSRRLMPGGFRDTTIRGWARPLRSERHSRPIKKTFATNKYTGGTYNV